MPKLLRAAAFLGAAVAAFVLLRARDASPREDAPLKGAYVSKIELSRGSKAKTLERRGSRWVGGPDEECAALAQALAGLRLGVSATRDASKTPALEVSDELAVRVRVHAEGEASPRLDGYFGAEALGPGTAYFRPYREEGARIASGVGRAALQRALDDPR